MRSALDVDANRKRGEMEKGEGLRWRLLVRLATIFFLFISEHLSGSTNQLFTICGAQLHNADAAFASQYPVLEDIATSRLPSAKPANAHAKTYPSTYSARNRIRCVEGLGQIYV